tara:strand:+ start:15605 stop:16102 length:498 start_codon:yes stop_codon:yes gene_type:complete
MIETEAKIPIEKQDLERLIEKLGTPEFFNQENIIYDFGESALRIRAEKGRTIITYKGPLEKSKFKSREEIEFSVNANPGKVARFFSMLDLQETLVYKKQRANYKLNGCTISLDILENNSHYIEIEGSETDIEKTIQALGLTDKPIEKRSYPDILGGKNGMHRKNL